MEDCLSDAVVNMITELIDVARTFRAICAADVFPHLRCVDAVNRIRKHFRSSTRDALGLVGTTLAEVPFYMDKVTHWVQQTASIKMNQDKLDRLEAFVQVDLSSGEVMDRVTEMVQRLQDLNYMQDELMDAPWMGKLVTQAKQKLVEMWDLVWPHLEEQDGLDLQGVKSLLDTACETFPGEKTVFEMQEALAGVLTRKSGREKVAAMVSFLVALAEKLSKGEPCTPEMQAELSEVVLKCRGLTVPMESWQPMSKALETLVTMVEQSYPKDLPACTKYVEMLKQASGWSDAKAKQWVQKVEHMLHLKMSLETLSSLNDDLGIAILNQPEQKTKLATLMRALQVAQTWPPEDGWLGTQLKKVLAEALALKTKTHNDICKQHHDVVLAAMAKLKPIAGGMPGGKTWSDEIVDQNWPGVWRVAEKTILQSNGPEVAAAAVELEKAMQNACHG